MPKCHFCRSKCQILVISYHSTKPTQHVLQTGKLKQRCSITWPRSHRRSVVDLGFEACPEIINILILSHWQFDFSISVIPDFQRSREKLSSYLCWSAVVLLEVKHTVGWIRLRSTWSFPCKYPVISFLAEPVISKDNTFSKKEWVMWFPFFSYLNFLYILTYDFLVLVL